jgi:hypothetical protein
MQKRAFWIPMVLATTAAILMGITISGYVPANSEEKQETVQARIRRLEDREAIRQLLMDYGAFLDRRDFIAFSKLFAEKEGEWIGGLGRAKGQQAILKLMEDSIGKDTKGSAAGNYHVFTNDMISVDGDQAKAITKWMFIVQGETSRPQPFYLGHYEDTIVREGGRWKFLRRAVYGDIPPDDPLAKK